MTAPRPSALRSLLATAIMALVLPGLAGAHALLIQAEPADGTRVANPPKVMRLRFSEAVSPRFRVARLLDARGREVSGVRVMAPPRTATDISISLPQLRQGTYGLVWRVLSKDDGHTTSGTVLFGVGAGAALTHHALAVPAPRTGDVALNWLRFSLLSVLIGGVAFTWLVGGASTRGLPELAARARRRVLAAAALAGAGAVVVELVALVREASALAGQAAWTSTVGDLLVRTRWGTWWAIETAALALLTALVVRLLQRSSARVPMLAALLAATAAVAEAEASHASASGTGTTAIAGLHVLAAAVWVGLVASAALALRDGRDLMVALRAPFAIAAGTSVALLATSGLYEAGREVASVDALLTTLYGNTVLVKSGLALLAFSLGAANFLLLRRRPRRLVWQPVAAEAAAAAVVLLAAGVLAAAAPARGPQFAPPRAVHERLLLRQVEDLVLTVRVRPNRPGFNFVGVAATSTRRPAPAPVTAVSIQVKGVPGVVPLHPVEGRGWFASVRIAHAGINRLRLLVSRRGEVLPAQTSWAVEKPDPVRTPRYSTRPLSTIVDALAVALLLSAAMVALGVAIAREHLTADRPRIATERW